MTAFEFGNRTGCIVNDAIVVLDRQASRYYLLRHTDDSACPIDASAERSVVLSWRDDVPVELGTASRRAVVRALRPVGVHQARASMVSLMRLRWLEMRYARWLRSGLHGALVTLPQSRAATLDERAIDRLIDSSWRAQRLWSSRDRCLPRSFALTHALREAGNEVALVIGVALHPFAAHAWVQDGDRVLNDTLDHVALFKPILVA